MRFNESLTSFTIKDKMGRSEVEHCVYFSNMDDVLEKNIPISVLLLTVTK